MEKSIDLRTVKVGDTLYRTQRINHFFSQKKLRMVDANGIEWYRYDKDRFEYIIETLTVVGKVTPTVEGEIDDGDYAIIRVYANVNGDKGKTELWQHLGEDQCDENNVFFDLGDAEAYRLELVEQDREADENE
jgi:hypothetical protein